MTKRLLFIVLISGCSAVATPVQSPIHWDDGDSGRIGDTRFRLADVDAPETRAVGSPIGPAKCERERELGYDAKRFMIDLTSTGSLSFEWNGETDRHGRKVGDIIVSKVSVSAEGLRSGHLRSWQHDDNIQLEPKPKWC